MKLSDIIEAWSKTKEWKSKIHIFDVYIDTVDDVYVARIFPNYVRIIGEYCIYASDPEFFEKLEKEILKSI